jgi:hypothetical protein
VTIEKILFVIALHVRYASSTWSVSMSSWYQFAISASLELLLYLAAIFCVFLAKQHKSFPAFWQFLLFRSAVVGILFADRFASHHHWISGVHAYYIYFYIYWPAFILSAFLMLRVLHELFRRVVSAIPGVQMLGQPIFFWAVAVSVVLAVAAGMTPHSGKMSLVLAAAQVLARSQSVLALCLLAFLTFASNALGVRYGSRVFGILFGFGMMATTDLVNAALLTRIPSLSSVENMVFEAVNIAAIGLWAVYFLKPEPERKLVTASTTSPLMRWNEIALLMGNPAGRVVVSHPAAFMTGVQETVERVVKRRPDIGLVS